MKMMDKVMDSQQLRSLYSVHVSNLANHITEEKLLELFSEAGVVCNTFIQPASSKYTYGFVRYQYSEEALKACKLLNNKVMDGFMLRVSIADDTRKKLSPPKTCNQKSIVRKPFPHYEGGKRVLPTAEKSIHAQLKRSLRSLQDDNDFTKWLGINTHEDVPVFLSDFKEILTTMSKVPESVGAEPFTFMQKPTNKGNLRDLIKRYHEAHEQEQLFKTVDLDLTNSQSVPQNVLYFASMGKQIN